MLKSSQFLFKEFWRVREGFLQFLDEICQEKSLKQLSSGSVLKTEEKRRKEHFKKTLFAASVFN